MNSFGAKVLRPRQRQPLTQRPVVRNISGPNAGHGKASEAICDPAAFSGVVEVPPGMLGHVMAPSWWVSWNQRTTQRPGVRLRGGADEAVGEGEAERLDTRRGSLATADLAGRLPITGRTVYFRCRCC